MEDVDVECSSEPEEDTGEEADTAEEEDTGEEEVVGAGLLGGKADAIFEATCFGTGAAAGAADLATSVALGVGTGLVVDFGTGLVVDFGTGLVVDFGAAGADVFFFDPEPLF